MHEELDSKITDGLTDGVTKTEGDPIPRETLRHFDGTSPLSTAVINLWNPNHQYSEGYSKRATRVEWPVRYAPADSLDSNSQQESQDSIEDAPES